MEYDAVNIEALLAEQDDDHVNAGGGAAAAAAAPLDGLNGLPDTLPPEDWAAAGPAGRHPPPRRAWPVHKRLQAAWLNEKAAPELLPYEGELVADLMAQLQEHVRAAGRSRGTAVARPDAPGALPAEGTRAETTGGGGPNAHGEPRVHGQPVLYGDGADQVPAAELPPDAADQGAPACFVTAA